MPSMSFPSGRARRRSRRRPEARGGPHPCHVRAVRALGRARHHSSERFLSGGRCRSRPAGSAAGQLLLDDVRRPAAGAGAGEHRGRDAAGTCASRARRRPRTRRSSRGAGPDAARVAQRSPPFRGRRHLDARRAELLRRPPEDAGPRVLGAVDAVAEAHDPVAPRQGGRRTYPSGSPLAATASSIGSTRAGAPP